MCKIWRNHWAWAASSLFKSPFSSQVVSKPYSTLAGDDSVENPGLPSCCSMFPEVVKLLHGTTCSTFSPVLCHSADRLSQENPDAPGK